jgi:hypothetical protein
VNDSAMPSTSASQSERSPLEERSGAKYWLWIDSVGTFLVCLGEKVTVGGPTSGAGAADVALLANLSRRHASFVRCGEEYLLEAHAAAQVDGRPVQERSHLSNGSRIRLGEKVEFVFRLPSALSRTARLEFASDHRPERSIEGIVLLDDTCLLGPQGEHHIHCPHWPDAVLIHRRGEELWCKSRAEVFVDGRHVPQGSVVQTGSIVSGPDFRFRLEAAG